MPRIIFISPHFKSGRAHAAHLSYLVRYISTREGVVPVASDNMSKAATQSQQDLIRQIVRDFPMAKKQFEYEDFCSRPTVGNASDFIQTALERNLDQIGKRENYVDYIGTRPGVSKLDSNGLFDSTGKKLVVSQVQKEITEHPGVIWTPVISLRREDACAMDFETPESWQSMLSSCAAELAKGYKIRPENLRWYAAFHDKSHHPHIHMIIYSTDPTEGFLTKQGISQIKAALAKGIFPEQLQELYAADTKQRDMVKADARKLYQELIDSMANGTVQNKRIEELTEKLVERLSLYKGKMQYGYLPAPAKTIVDDIVDELSKDERVAQAYRLWFDIRTDIISTYQDEKTPIPPLSTQKEFKPVRNMVVTEAAKLVGRTFSFEETASDEPKLSGSIWQLMRAIKSKASRGDEMMAATASLLQIADRGNPDASYLIGKMLLSGEHIKKDIPKAVEYLSAAAHGGNAHAMYQLGKLYLSGEDVPKDPATALRWFTDSAERGDTAAQYVLGKLYLAGEVVAKDTTAAFQWVSQSADQGNQYAQFFVDHWQDVKSPSSFIAATRLLHHMSRVFQDNTPARRGGKYQLDKKLLRKLKQKKIAQGHKEDDHEQDQSYIMY
jgi:TPR repeat protein